MAQNLNTQTGYDSSGNVDTLDCNCYPGDPLDLYNSFDKAYTEDDAVGNDANLTFSGNINTFEEED
jgi:hypothetical protein